MGVKSGDCNGRLQQTTWLQEEKQAEEQQKKKATYNN